MDWSAIANLEFYMLGGLIGIIIVSVRRVINNFEKDISDIYKKIYNLNEKMHAIDKITAEKHAKLTIKIEHLIEGVEQIGKKVCNGKWRK